MKHYPSSVLQGAEGKPCGRTWLESTSCRPAHFAELESCLAHFNATSVTPGTWIIHSDYCVEALWVALRMILDDTERLFLAPLEEGFQAQNIDIGVI